jgi:ADP-ribose pyrophosphatase
MVEIPAGLLDKGEDAKATVLRETREEAGLETDLLEPVGRFVLTPGACDEACTIFVGRVRAPACGADGLAGTGGLAAEEEDIRIRIVPAQTAISRALAGEYPNSVTTIALLWLGAHHERLRTAWLS